MTLIKQIERIIFDEGLTLREFYTKSGLSSKVYYAIKNGTKTKLKPSQAKKLNAAFPNYSYDWLMGEKNITNELTANYGSIMDIAKEGKLGKILNKNHDALLEIDESYNLWFEKITYQTAFKILNNKNR